MSEFVIECDYDFDDGWIPSEHREQVVRCRDCKHCEMQKVRYQDGPLLVCIAEWCKGSEGDNPLVELNGFCAWGEREERIES